MSLKERKEQLVNNVSKTTAIRVKALNEQFNKLLNLSTQMNGYLELIEIKLRSERDRAIVAMKDQMVNRGNSLLKVVRSTSTSPIETVPPKVEFPRLQNVLNLVKVLGISFSSETCNVVEITVNPNKPTFRVIAKDTFDQPILDCLSLLDVKIFPNKDSYDKQQIHKKQCSEDVELPKVTNEGNGIYEFSTTCDNSLHTRVATGYYDDYFHGQPYVRQRRAAQQKYGLVSVQLFGKDVLESPLK